MKKTFTLIELLVVVAIIGILSSILMPSLSKARQKAIAAVCKSNLSSQGKGMFILMGDGTPSGKQDAFPGYAGRDVNNELYTWHGEVAESLGLTDSESSPYLLDTTKPPSTFKCPAESTVSMDFTPDNLAYGYNYGHIGEYQAYGNSTHDALAVYQGQIHQPSAMIMITDSNGDGSFDYLSHRAWAAANPGARHLERANILHIDGHVMSYTLAPLLTNQAKPYFPNYE